MYKREGWSDSSPITDAPTNTQSIAQHKPTLPHTYKLEQVECRYDPANLSKNKKGWSFFDEKDLQAALDNSYQVGTQCVVGGGVYVETRVAETSMGS